MFWSYAATGAASTAVGISFFPRRRYRFWWRWLHDQRVDVCVSILFFCTVNAATAVAAFAAASAANVAPGHNPIARVVAAVAATQAILRGRAPRYGQTSSSETTLISRISDWFIKDLDGRAIEKVVEFSAGLQLPQSVELAGYLHDTFTAADPDQNPTVKNNEKRKLEAARRALRGAITPPAGPEPARRSVTAAAADTDEEMRRLCREIILRSHASLARSQLDRYGLA